MQKKDVPRLSAPMSSVSEQIGKIRSQFQRDQAVDPDAHKEIIREIGLKVTQQRMQILEILQCDKKHITAQSLFETVRKKSPTIGFATVYRFLKVLSQHEYISEVRIGNLPARYEWNIKEHHDHLTCIECGAVTEFENEKLELLQVEIARHFGYTLTDHLLELFGVCPACRAKVVESSPE